MKKQILIALLLVAGAGLLQIISCSKGGSSYNNSTTGGTTYTSNTIDIKNMAFSPGTLTITAGTTVTWENMDAMTHTVTADDNSFDSGNMVAGAKFSKAFNTVGTFPYHCTIHSGMTASIVVK